MDRDITVERSNAGERCLSKVKEIIIGELVAEFCNGDGCESCKFLLEVTGKTNQEVTFRLRSGFDCPGFFRVQGGGYAPIARDYCIDSDTRLRLTQEDTTDIEATWQSMSITEPLTAACIAANVDSFAG